MNKIFNLIIFFLVLIFSVLSSCKKDNPTPEKMNPTMKSIQVSGENKNFEAKITFSEGVYSNANMTGDLNINNNDYTRFRGLGYRLEGRFRL